MLPLIRSFPHPFKIFLLFLLFQQGFNTCINGQVSQIDFKKLTTNDGLSDGVIRSIGQDKYGFIWIGTSYGLNRFDGIAIKKYFSKNEDSTSLTNNLVQCIYSDKKGDLWIGTFQGLCRFDYHQNKFIRYKAPVRVVVMEMMQDATGKLWFGTDQGFWNADEKTKTLIKYDPPVNKDQKAKYNFTVRQIIETSPNRWYIASNTGIMIFDPLKGGLEEIRHDPADKASLSADLIYSMCLDASGHLWVATNSGKATIDRISLDNLQIKKYSYFSDPQKRWSTNILFKILADHSGKVWASSAFSGISFYDPQKDDFDDISSDPLMSYNPLSNPPSVIFQGKEGIIWLGTAGYGLRYFDPGKNFMNTINPYFQYNNILVETWGRSACEDKQNNLWMATGRGMVKYDREHEKFQTYANEENRRNILFDNSLRSLLCDDEGDLWVGTVQGLNRYHPSTGVMDFFTEKQGMPPLYFYWMIDKDKQGQVWLGSASGLFRYDRSQNRFDDLTKDPVLSVYAHKNIQALYADKHNRLWIGIMNVGLVIYDVDKKQQKLLTVKDSLISDTRFSSFAEDKEGMIWIGAEDGLTVYNPMTHQSRFFTRENGLPSDRTNNIMVDSLNRVWIGTSNGLCMLNEQRDKIRVFDVNDGLPTNQFNEQAAYKTHDGLFVYPSYKGFVIFRPEDYIEKNQQIPVYITSFKVSDKEIEPAAENLEKIRLKHDQNFFSIELAGLNFMNPYRCTYAYKLEPFDKNWIYSKKREINYTNVPAGNYTFRYKVISDANDSEVAEKTLKLSIGQVFYKTTWFKALMLLLGLFGLIAFFRFRLNQREKILVLQGKAQSLEKEKALVQFENLKQQLNPHFLFNSLTSLRSLIRVNPKTATHFLDGLSKTYRYLLKSGDAELVPLEDELNFVDTFVGLQKTRFENGLEVQVNVDPAHRSKYIVPVTLQNLIENAIKHNTTSPEQPLRIDIFTENNSIVVKNNLQRYRLVETSNRRGLASMKSLYSYLSDKPITIEEDDKFFTVKIPLL